jgi:hypothetical protein
LKIAFWSNVSKTCGVTSNLAAISVASVIRYPYTVVALENRLCSNNLGKALLGCSRINGTSEVGTNYYDGGGIEGLMRKVYRGEYQDGMLSTYLKEIISEHLYYVPQSRVIHSEIFDYEFDRSIQPLLRMTDEFADICFIDTANHNNLSTKTILEEADLIVVNLCQKQSILEDFFLNYSSLISKAVFIISNYEFNTKLNMKRISSMYEIPEEKLVIIPFNGFYQNAITNGSVVEFISGNYSCLKGNPNFIFIQSVKKAAHIIIKKAVEITKTRETGMCIK